MPEDRVFLDSNIIIYGYDISAGRKHEIAKKLTSDLWNSGSGILSTQVMQEFFVKITTRISKPLNVNSAKKIIYDFLQWDIVVNDEQSILEAIEIHLRYKYSFWDSLIIQSAVKGGATLLLSEDLSDGQTIDGVKIRNPFKGI